MQWDSYIFKHSLNDQILLGPLFCMLHIKYQVSLLTYISLYISYSVSVNHRRAVCECAPEGWSLAPQQINTQTSSLGRCWRKTHCLSVKVPLNPGRLEKHQAKHHVVHPLQDVWAYHADRVPFSILSYCSVLSEHSWSCLWASEEWEVLLHRNENFN